MGSGRQVSPSQTLIPNHPQLDARSLSVRVLILASVSLGRALALALFVAGLSSESKEMAGRFSSRLNW